MKVALVGALLLAALVAGCGSDPANPNLLAPKVVVQPGEGGVTVYVHSAFGEYAYDRMIIMVDNETLAEGLGRFSLEERIPSQGFFLTVRAEERELAYELSARVDVDDDRLRVALVDDDGQWSDPRSFGAPFERIVERVAEASG